MPGKDQATRRNTADVKPRRPRIMTTLVSSAFFREPQNNPAKTDLAIKTLDLARQQKIALLVLPAGFLTVATRAEVMPAVRPILRLAKRHGISVVVGVDLAEIRSYRTVDSGKMLEAYCTFSIPLFLVVYDAATNKTEVYRQRSATSYHARLGVVPDAVMQPRILILQGVPIATCFCGELYEPRLFGKNAPPTAIIVGHTTMPRLGRTFKAKGREGFSVIHSEHRVGRGGTLLCNDLGIDRGQLATLHIEGENGLWLEVAIWEVTDKGRILPARPEDCGTVKKVNGKDESI